MEYINRELKEWEYSRRIDNICIWIAWKLLPRKLVYWASVRLITHATVGKYSNQVVNDLKAVDALNRWY